MKKALTVIIFISILFLTSCAKIEAIINDIKEPKYTSSEWEEKQKVEQIAQNLVTENLQKETEIKERTTKIKDYQERLDGYNKFFNAVADLEKKYGEINESVELSFNNCKTLKEQIPYAKVLKENYDKWFKELSEVKIVECGRKAYNHYLEALGQRILFYNYIINQDITNMNKADNESSIAYTKSFKELDIIQDNFNREATGLGLNKPFSDEPHKN